jgi:cobyrinic acid a,c-diamide synthase
MKGIVIAGINSGCGKTTVTMGLLALLQDAGYKIAPFKTGPDFIDPVFHGKVTGTNSYNLDSFLLSREVIQYLYSKHCKDKDFAVVEGVMGLFDGLGHESAGSTAQLSKILGLPVILVVSCKSLYQSVAAIIAGYKQFDTEVNIAGVILNHAPGGESYNFLKNYIETHTGVPCVGYLPSNKEISLESRHLGLVQAEEVDGFSQKLGKLKATFSETIDLKMLESIANKARPTKYTKETALPWKRNLHGLRLGVAFDKAFQFYYRDNLELLQENGAKLLYFSPIEGEHLPKGVQALYYGGGYPEVFARELSNNNQMLSEVKNAAIAGLSIFAECGGLMYLTAGISDLQEVFYPMANVFNCTTLMTSRLQRFGYCNVQYEGVNTCAHEFHHSQLKPATIAPNYRQQFQINKPEKNKQWTCGLQHKNVLAGYPHFHFWSGPQFYHKIIDLWMQKTISF